MNGVTYEQLMEDERRRRRQKPWGEDEICPFADCGPYYGTDSGVCQHRELVKYDYRDCIYYFG